MSFLIQNYKYILKPNIKCTLSNIFIQKMQNILGLNVCTNTHMLLDFLLPHNPPWIPLHFQLKTRCGWEPWHEGGKKRARQNSLSLITKQFRIKGLKIKIQFLPHQRSIGIRRFTEEPPPSAKHPLIEILFNFYSEYCFTSGSVGGFAPGIHCKQLSPSWTDPWSSQLGLHGVRADPSLQVRKEPKRLPGYSWFSTRSSVQDPPVRTWSRVH